MPQIPQSPNRAPASPRETFPFAFDRRPPREAEADARAGALPPELDFIAGERVSGQRLLAALTAAPAGAPPLDVLLNEGMLPEETYYRALARRLGCEYYGGEPPFAKNFDPVKSLKCGVAPVYERGQPVRAVIAPGARSVRGLIEMTRSGRLHPTSFAADNCPQRRSRE